jgi:hypothetical protein
MDNNVLEELRSIELSKTYKIGMEVTVGLRAKDNELKYYDGFIRYIGPANISSGRSGVWIGVETKQMGIS